MPAKSSELIINDGKIYHLGLRPDQITKNIFLVGDPARVEKVAAHFDKIEHRVSHREFLTVTGRYKDMPVSVISTGIGTDNVEITLVELFALNEYDFKARKRKGNSSPLTLIRIGTCGGIQQENDVGTLVISKYAIGMDSTGLFFQQKIPDKISNEIEKEAYRIITESTPKNMRFRGKISPYVSKASEEIVDSLIKNAKKLGYSYTSGITTTAPGFFGAQGRKVEGLIETIPNLQENLAELKINGEKIINFEMESSLLFHLSQHLGYRAGTICPIIANRPKGTFLADYSEAIGRSIDVGLNSMYELYKKN